LPKQLYQKFNFLKSKLKNSINQYYSQSIYRLTVRVS